MSRYQRYRRVQRGQSRTWMNLLAMLVLLLIILFLSGDLIERFVAVFSGFDDTTSDQSRGDAVQEDVSRQSETTQFRVIDSPIADVNSGIAHGRTILKSALIRATAVAGEPPSSPVQPIP